jgi:hypothetical protein
MNSFKLLLSSLVVIAALNIQTAHAQVVYADRSDFNAAYPAANQENWDSYASGLVIPNGSALSGITYSTTSKNDLAVSTGWVSSSGSNSLAEANGGFFTNSDNVTFTFSHPLTAFAIDINTFSTTSGDYTANTNTGDIAASFFDPFPSDDFTTGQFIGFSDANPFTSITIEDISNAYTLDTLQYVYAPTTTSAVPEPSTVALMMVGLLGVAAFSLRRKLALIA